MKTTHPSRSGQVTITVQFRKLNGMWDVAAERQDGTQVGAKFFQTEAEARAYANQLWATDGVAPQAEALGRVTGSRQATYVEEHVAVDGTTTTSHQDWFSSTGQASLAPVATERQVAYITSLATERGLTVDTAGMTKAQASAKIDELLNTPRPAAPAATPVALPDVPQGHYAVASRTGNNDLDFFRVDRPTDGTWAGRTFVKRVIGGHEDQRLNLAETRLALEAIVATGPQEAARRYGQEIGRCGRCNRHLTDAESRAYGLGPDCRSKGW